MQVAVELFREYGVAAVEGAVTALAVPESFQRTSRTEFGEAAAAHRSTSEMTFSLLNVSL